MFLTLKLEGYVGGCAHLQWSGSSNLLLLLPGGCGGELRGEAPAVVGLCWWAGGSCPRQAQRLRVTVVVSALGSARSQSCRFQVELGSLDSIAGGSQEVCKKLGCTSFIFHCLESVTYLQVVNTCLERQVGQTWNYQCKVWILAAFLYNRKGYKNFHYSEWKKHLFV